MPHVSRRPIWSGDQGRNNSRKNEGMEPKQKQRPVVNRTGDGSKVRCCKEHIAWGWCTGTTQRDDMGREEGGGVQDWEHVYTRGRLMLIYGKTITIF